MGLGALGHALAHSLAHSLSANGLAGVRLVAVSSRRTEAAHALANVLPGVTAADPYAMAAHVDLVLLAVADNGIAEAAAHPAWTSGLTVVHTSGVNDLTPLDAARARGARVGSFHPLVSIPRSDMRADRFTNASAALDGDASVLVQLESLARALGMDPVVVPAQWRARWHAAATLVGNASAALAALAEGMLEGLPVEPHALRGAFAGLLRSVSENIEQLDSEASTAAAISGPVVRADIDTVSRHLQSLRSEASSRNVDMDAYQLAANLVLRAAGDRISRQARASIEPLLKESNPR